MIFWIILVINGILKILSYIGLPAWHEQFFAFVYSNIMGPGMAGALDKQKSVLFAPLQEPIVKDQDVTNKHTLRLLEIGAGPGLNLKYFKQETRWIPVDKNKFFTKYLQKNLESFPCVQLEQNLMCPAENMSEIDDCSIDVVVSTYVLCSVTNLSKVLKEMYRVLAPGGRFFYLEHVGYCHGSCGRFIQRLVQPLWGTSADGCILTREISDSIQKVGFASIAENYYFIDNHTYLMKPHISGIAQK